MTIKAVNSIWEVKNWNIFEGSNAPSLIVRKVDYLNDDEVIELIPAASGTSGRMRRRQRDVIKVTTVSLCTVFSCGRFQAPPPPALHG